MVIRLSAGQHFFRIREGSSASIPQKDKVLIPEKDIIDAALALLPQSGIIRLRRSQTVAAEGLNNIVDQIGGGGLASTCSPLINPETISLIPAGTIAPDMVRNLVQSLESISS